MVLVPIIFNKYYYSRLNVKFEDVIKNLDPQHDPTNVQIVKKLDEKIKGNVGNNIITYLKICATC